MRSDMGTSTELLFAVVDAAIAWRRTQANNGDGEVPAATLLVEAVDSFQGYARGEAQQLPLPGVPQQEPRARVVCTSCGANADEPGAVGSLLSPAHVHAYDKRPDPPPPVPKTKEPGERICNYSGCERTDVTHRYTWPGQPEAFICPGHL